MTSQFFRASQKRVYKKVVVKNDIEMESTVFKTLTRLFWWDCDHCDVLLTHTNLSDDISYS